MVEVCIEGRLRLTAHLLPIVQCSGVPRNDCAKLPQEDQALLTGRPAMVSNHVRDRVHRGTRHAWRPTLSALPPGAGRPASQRRLSYARNYHRAQRARSEQFHTRHQRPFAVAPRGRRFLAVSVETRSRTTRDYVPTDVRFHADSAGSIPVTRSDPKAPPRRGLRHVRRPVRT